MIQNQREENKKWYDQKMAEDYTQRSDAQNVLRKQKELLDEQYQRARATNVVAGGTDESLALQKAAANEAMGETMADIASQASDYKESVEQQYRAKDDAYVQQLAGIEQAKAQNIANAAGQVSSAIGGLMTGASAEKAGDVVTPGATTATTKGIDNTPAFDGSEAAQKAFAKSIEGGVPEIAKRKV